MMDSFVILATDGSPARRRMASVPRNARAKVQPWLHIVGGGALTCHGWRGQTAHRPDGVIHRRGRQRPTPNWGVICKASKDKKPRKVILSPPVVLPTPTPTPVPDVVNLFLGTSGTSDGTFGGLGEMDEIRQSSEVAAVQGVRQAWESGGYLAFGWRAFVRSKVQPR